MGFHSGGQQQDIKYLLWADRSGEKRRQRREIVRSIPPVALIPIEGFTATTSACPTLFFNIPTLPANSSLPVKFTLLDGNKAVYQTKFPLTGNLRTIGISLPSTGELQPLEIDRDYRWIFSLQCGKEAASASHSITGMIRRVAPDAALTEKLAAFARAVAEPSKH